MGSKQKKVKLTISFQPTIFQALAFDKQLKRFPKSLLFKKQKTKKKKKNLF